MPSGDVSGRHFGALGQNDAPNKATADRAYCRPAHMACPYYYTTQSLRLYTYLVVVVTSKCAGAAWTAAGMAVFVMFVPAFGGAHSALAPLYGSLSICDRPDRREAILSESLPPSSSGHGAMTGAQALLFVYSALHYDVRGSFAVYLHSSTVFQHPVIHRPRFTQTRGP